MASHEAHNLGIGRVRIPRLPSSLSRIEEPGRPHEAHNLEIVGSNPTPAISTRSGWFGYIIR